MNVLMWLERRLEALGVRVIDLLSALGGALWFLLCVLFRGPSGGSFRRSFYVFVRQVYFLGVLSSPIILLAGLFVGMVLGLQGVNILRTFGAEENTGQLAVLAAFRELSPALSALLYAGRAGSAMTAEIGLMKTTEQLSALEMMGVDPMDRVFAPRLWGSVVALPLLVIFFSAVSILGSHVMAVVLMHVDSGAYWSNIREITGRSDLEIMLLKGVVFSFLIAWVSVYQGVSCKPTSEGVALASTKTVVYASVLVLGMNFVLSALWF